MRHVVGAVDERTAAGASLNIELKEFRRRMLDTKAALETQRLGAAGEVRDGYLIAKDVARAPHETRLRCNFKFPLEESLVMIIARAQHHRVLAEAHWLLVTISGDVSAGQNPHCRSVCRTRRSVHFLCQNRSCQ